MVLIVTSCTGRKRFETPPHLDVSNLPMGNLKMVSEKWVASCKTEVTLYPPKRLYIGRPMVDARRACNLANSDLNIISAGLGLISDHNRIPSYNLTVQKQSPHSIQTKIIEPIEPKQWWEYLNIAQQKKNPVANLVSNNKGQLVLIACPKNYAKLIEDDLLTLEKSDFERVRIIGPKTYENFPKQIQKIILPYDNNFDGPDSPIPGTRTDFAQRALLHFVKEVLNRQTQQKDLDFHFNYIRNLMKEMRPPKQIARTTMNDDQIVLIIKRCWGRAEGKSGKMLRVLRDQENVACEQSRFAKLFKIARERYNL